MSKSISAQRAHVTDCSQLTWVWRLCSRCQASSRELESCRRAATILLPMTRGHISLALLTCSLVQSAFASVTNVHPQNPYIARGPYVQLATPNSIFVVWRTETNIQANVRYGLHPGRLDRIVKNDDIIVRYGTTNKTLPRPRIL